MSQPDLRSSSIYAPYQDAPSPGYPDLYYTGENADINVSVRNDGADTTEAFDVDLYLSTDDTIDTSDLRLATHNFADGINWWTKTASVNITLPDINHPFWIDGQQDYYMGTIVDPNDAIAESDETNNVSESSYVRQVAIEQTELPVVKLNQSDEDTLAIELNQPAPEGGLAIDYRALTKADYINDTEGKYTSYSIYRSYDSELDRLYLTGESYYDLEDYKYYDTAGGHYDPVENKYFNANGSYYDIAEQLFYDVDANATELTNNRAEYDPDYMPPVDEDGDGMPDDSYYSRPRHYLPTGGYISFYSNSFYDSEGGYIGDSYYGDGKEYFSYENEGYEETYGIRISEIRGENSVGSHDIFRLPRIATLNEDYELVAGSNITDLTDTTITIAPGETTATVDLSFLPDFVYDPEETVRFKLAEGEEYLIGRPAVAPSDFYWDLYQSYETPKVGLDELENPETGSLNFNVPENADAGTVVGQVNFSDPQGDELTYFLVTGHASDEYYYSDDYQYAHPEIDLDSAIIETSNQDLDGDGVAPFSIDPDTGVITLTDYDDLDREPSYVAPTYDDEFYYDYTEPQPQLYNSGYYQLFVKVTDGSINFNHDSIYGEDNQLYEASLVNVKVIDIPATPGDDNIRGFSSSDIIDGLAGNDTIKGLTGNDTLIGNDGDDRINGGPGYDSLDGGLGKDSLLGGADGDSISGGEDKDLLNGGTGADLLEGDSGNDRLLGGAGADRDTLRGGDGKDQLLGGAGNDILMGGIDNDTLIGMIGDDSLDGGMGNDILNGVQGDDTLKGMEGDDMLRGDVGMDLVSGDEGNDRLFGMDDDDTMHGGLDNDTLHGGAGSDILFGMEGEDLIRGGLNNDTLHGGLDNDILHGGAGIDYLHGDAGADTFALEADMGQDLIIDFEVGIDAIAIPNNLSFEELNIVDLPIYSATIIQDSNTSEVLAVLQNVAADMITAADFV